MLLIEYSPETQFSASLTVICMIFSIIIAGIILRKAIKSRERLIFLFFLVFILIFSSWYGTGIGYIYWLITEESISYELFMIITNAFWVLGILIWIYIYLTAIYPNKRKIILIIITIFVLIHEIYLFYFLFFAPNAPVKELLGEVYELQTSYAGFLLISGLILSTLACGAGIHFSIFSMNKNNQKVTQWKGRFLLVAFVLFFTVGILETLASSQDLFLIVITRILLIITMFFLYIGFLMPDYFKKLLAIES
jgi:hypothetical protein